MVPRIRMILLGLGILSMVAGCAVDPAPYSISPYEGYRQHETSQGHQYGGGIDCERKTDEEERQYRRQRSAQERELERRQQQWEQEQARDLMERARLAALHTPFPNGESYAQVALRMRSFLTQLADERDGQHVMLVGHGATLWMLAHWLQEQPLEAVVGVFPERPWHFALDPQHWHKATPRAAP